jgi:hypothetical protein
MLLGPQPHGLVLVVEYSVEPAVLDGFSKKILFCFSVFLSSLLPPPLVLDPAAYAKAAATS